MPCDTEYFPPDLEEILQNIVKKENYVTYTVEKKLNSTKGIGFLAKPFFITINGKTKDGDKKMNIYVKTAVDSSCIGEVLDVPQAYISEAFAYNNLSEVFTELQDEAGIAEEDRFKMINSYGMSNSKAIFLDNVAIQGYECVPRTASTTLEVAELAIKQIAKFHAFSFIIREKRPDFYKQMLASKTPMLFKDSTDKGMMNMMNMAVKHLDDRFKEKIERLLPDFIEKCKEYSRDEITATSCLCHGDFRLHNLLVKQQGEDLDLYVVDFQLLHMNSPVIDVLYFLFTGTDGRLRSDHFDHLKNLYYDSFREFLSKFGIDSDDVYSKKTYETEFNDRLDYGLICALYILPITLAADDDIPDTENTSIDELHFKVHESFPQRLRDIVNDFYNWGLL